MAETTAARLRALLGERIPEGGSDSDTMFTDAEIADIMLQGGPRSDIYLMAMEGWERKAAEYASLPDIQIAGTQSKQSVLAEEARRQANRFRQKASGRDKMTVGRISRAGPLPR